MNKNFCVKPWQGLYVNSSGEFRPCPFYKNSLGKTLDEYMSSTELQELKDAFVRGEQPLGCERCFQVEQYGLPNHVRKYTDEIPASHIFKQINIPWDSTCNLSCRICSVCFDECNSTCAELLGENSSQDYSRFYIELLDRLMPELVHIIWGSAGELFLTNIPKHKELLKKFITANRASKVSLNYITNLTMYPDEEFWELWSHFKHVIICGSIDGVGTHFEYNRWPAKWDVCYSNIKRYQVDISNRDNIVLSFTHVISIFTVYYLPEFIAWCEQTNIPFVDVNTILLERPWHYAIKNIPEDAKKHIITKYLTSQKHIDTSKVNDTYHGVINALSLVADLQQFADFCHITNELDNHRNQQFATTFPEFYELLRF